MGGEDADVVGWVGLVVVILVIVNVGFRWLDDAEAVGGFRQGSFFGGGFVEVVGFVGVGAGVVLVRLRNRNASVVRIEA